MIRFLSILSLIYCCSSFAKIKEVIIIDPLERRFDFPRICRFKGIGQAPLIEIKNSLTLDCMGFSVKVNEFCEDKFKDNLIKSFIDKKDKKVVCQTGKGARVKIICDKKHKKFCRSKLKGCESIHKIIAKDIPLIHSSVISENGQKSLNCYFLNGQGADYF